MTQFFKTKPWRSVLTALAAIMAVYTAYWFGLSALLRHEFQDWRAARQAEGFTLNLDERGGIAGFPGALQWTVQDFRLLRGDAPDWRVRKLKLMLAPWAPLTLRVSAEGEQSLTLPWGARAERLILAAAQMEAQVHFRPFAAPEAISADLQDVHFGGVVAGNGVGSVPFFSFRAETAAFALQFPARAPATSNDLGLAPSLTLTNVQLQDQWQSPLGTLVPSAHLLLRVMGVPPNPALRPDVERWRNEGGTLEIDALALNWGPLSLKGQGTLALSRDLQLEGAFTAAVRGQDALLDALRAAGKIEPVPAAAARAALGILSKPSPIDGQPEINAPITAQNGGLYLGPLRLLALPRLVW